MAMIDYGAIVWKDGKLISTDMFTPMEEMVGWTDDHKHGLKGNYFAYIGDKDFTVAFYKSMMRIYSSDESYDETIYFGDNFYKGWLYWKRWFMVGNDMIDNCPEIIVWPRPFHDYYICTMTYRGHKYKVAFGYGVDLKYYKKTHIIDYYGTPWFRAKGFYRKAYYKIEDWKYELNKIIGARK